jgi:putative Mg2+ transporter-C (MgtC) family protein
MDIFLSINWEIGYRLFLAATLGAFIGAERSFFKKQAGLRTFALVALGAALFSYLGSTIEPQNPSRVLANIVVGIGFLGAGLIFLHEEKVIGLTTAAALWVTTAIGSAIGLGYYFEGFWVTILSLIILWALTYIERLIRKEE